MEGKLYYDSHYDSYFFDFYFLFSDSHYD